MKETYVRPTTCNGCGKPRSRPATFLCNDCAPSFSNEVREIDDYDPDGDSLWSADGKGNTQVSLGTLEPEEVEYDAINPGVN